MIVKKKKFIRNEKDKLTRRNELHSVRCDRAASEENLHILAEGRTDRKSDPSRMKLLIPSE